MNTPRLTIGLLALALAGTPLLHAATVTLVNNTNASDVPGGATDYVSQIFTGQTLYVGIPYAGGTWPLTDAADYFTVSTYLLSEGGSSTVSFQFFTAQDSGTALSSITALANFSAGSAAVAAASAGQPSNPANTSVAGVTAQIDYANLTGNPFSTISNGMLWLGITNTGSNTVSYYTGDPFGLGIPAPVYSYASPFDTEMNALLPDTYTYNGNGSLGSANQNVHPYISIDVVTVPEPASAMLAGLAGLGLLLRRNRRA